MAIIKLDSFRELERFFDEDDFFGFFPAVRRHLGPAMDVYENDTEVIVEMQIPKIDPTKLDITVEDSTLKVEGGEDQEKEEKDKNYYRREIKRGKFSKAITLPVPVKEDEVTATHENGILKIVLPKEEIKQAKKIEIQVN